MIIIVINVCALIIYAVTSNFEMLQLYLTSIYIIMLISCIGCYVMDDVTLNAPARTGTCCAHVCMPMTL